MKRARSSDSLDLAPHLKLHVTEKEVNLGVQADFLMQKVYEKTLNYLKEGAKIESPDSKRYLNGWLNRKNENPERKLRQMIFNQNLQLQSSENDQKKVPLIDMCDCGEVIDPVSCSVCRFCNQPLCRECSADCSDCRQTFCKECSLTVYTESDHQICLDCFSFSKQ